MNNTASIHAYSFLLESLSLIFELIRMFDKKLIDLCLLAIFSLFILFLLEETITTTLLSLLLFSI